MVVAGKLSVVVVVVLIATISTSVSAESSMLQDVCVADFTSAVTVNGFACKPTFNASDFFFAGLITPGAPNQLLGITVTPANVKQIPGLNTVGVSMARLDFAPGGINPPHTHPRGTEILILLNGQLNVGFITTANVLVSTTINPGDVFVFPQALVHFQQNNGTASATAISAFDSQNPGVQQIATTLFASVPSISDNVLSKAFQISNQQVDAIKSSLG